jgi:AcrR family transcriptional regulator
VAARKYHSPRRADAAAETREAILRGAHALFLARGYAGVTIGEIAETANVAVPTVYGSVGSKPAILTALVEPALTDPAISDHLTAVGASDNPRAVIELTAKGARLTHERHWDVVYGLFYRDPPGEPAVKTVADRAADDYVRALSLVADRLLTLKGLRADVSHADALDLLWFYAGPYAWTTLVGQRAWTFDRAQTWIARSACHALLRDSRG